MSSKNYIIIALCCFILNVLWSQPVLGHRYISSKTLILIYKYTKLNETDKDYVFKYNQEQIDNISNKVAKLREFYWRNSKMKLNLEFDYLICENPITKKELKMNSGALALDVDNVFEDVKASQKDPSQYASIIAFWSPNNNSFGGTMAGTTCWAGWVRNGIAALIDIPRIDPVLSTLIHEYHHIIHHMYYAGGSSDFTHTHFDSYQAEKQEGIKGVGCEFFAHSLSKWPKEKWFDHGSWSWGREGFAVDADGDGLPDFGKDGSGQDLALTESSLGTDPLNSDTDGDGLSDLDEVTTHFFKGSNPVNDVDTDKDNIIDGEDVYPLHKAVIGIQPAAPIIDDNKINFKEHNFVSRIDYMPKALIDSYISWDNNHLYFAFDAYTIKKYVFLPNSFQIYFDFNCDGILNGNDNFGIHMGYEAAKERYIARVFRCKGGAYDICVEENLDFNFMSFTYDHDLLKNKYCYEISVPLKKLFNVFINKGLMINMLIFYNDFKEKLNPLLNEITGDQEVLFSKIVLTDSEVGYLELSEKDIVYPNNSNERKKQKSVTLSNFGSHEISVDQIYASSSKLQVKHPPFTLRPREKKDIQFIYQSRQSEPLNEAIFIETSATNGPVLQLSCRTEAITNISSRNRNTRRKGTHPIHP